MMARGDGGCKRKIAFHRCSFPRTISIMKKGQRKDGNAEYDFSKGERGKYAKRYAERTSVVALDPDVAVYFPDAESVNDALRALVKIARRNGKPTTSK